MYNRISNYSKDKAVLEEIKLTKGRKEHINSLSNEDIIEDYLEMYRMPLYNKLIQKVDSIYISKLCNIYRNIDYIENILLPIAIAGTNSVADVVLMDFPEINVYIEDNKENRILLGSWCGFIVKGNYPIKNKHRHKLLNSILTSAMIFELEKEA